MNPVVITLVGRDGCHLCDDAREAITDVIADFAPGSVELREKSIDQDQELFALYWEQIPVVFIDEKMHNFWRIDETRLRAALMKAVSPS